MKSYWIDSVNKSKKEFLKLSEDLTTDVCIIGGGLTGLTTAYYLSKTNLKTIVLEKYKICEHTTGKSTAKITSQHGLFYDYLIKSQGREKAKQYLEANEQAIKNIENIIKKENIDCDFEKQNAYVYATKEEEVTQIKEEVKAVNSLGLDAEFVNNLEIPIKTVGAIKFKNQAKFNPCEYAQGLINAIGDKSKIFENTKVIDLKNKDRRYEVITENGKKVIAKYVVIATHYPIINAPGYYFLKMYQSMSYVIGVETQEKLFDGMYISNDNPAFSLRTAKYRDKELLIVAGLDHKTGEKKNLSKNYETLENIVKRYYPNSKVLYKWCTEDCISLDKIPYIGEFSNLMPNVYVATGYKKWGITTSNVAANIIVDKIMGRKNSFEDVFTSTRLKPIKNYQEMGNMIKEINKSLVVKKFKIPKEKIEDIKSQEGGIIEFDGKKIGIYIDKENNIYAVKPVCSHLGCELSWNNLENTWDCPCHGSRFTYDGKSIYDPSIKDLEKIELE